MSDAADSPRLRVVLADDHDVVRAGLAALLRASPGISVEAEARDGVETIQKVGEVKPDVLVLDISMPQMDGIEVTERVTAQWPDVRVLVLTAHDDRAHLQRLMHAGAAGYLLKRAAADELVRAIHVVADGGTYVDAQLAGTILRERIQAPSHAPGVTPVLSQREEQVLRSIAWGESNKQIAGRLGISTKTVETYRARIADKLGLRTRTEIVRFAVKEGWLSE
jgi:DNA-binding NarL/FixJ family response regulator